MRFVFFKETKWKERLKRLVSFNLLKLIALNSLPLKKIFCLNSGIRIARIRDRE
jgi:hypothetical protein